MYGVRVLRSIRHLGDEFVWQIHPERSRRMMKKLRYYFKIWWLLTRNSFSIVLGQRVVLLFFLTGKILRFSLFIGFLYFLIQGTNGLAGYSGNQAVFFFLVFNLVDVFAQFFFREVYRFRPKIVSGDFDLSLIKPANALFVSLLGGADVIDFFTIPPLLIAVFYVGSQFHPNILYTTYFILLLLNGFLIAVAFHIAVLAMGIITLEIDHTIMIYRDLTSFGRFPVDIYKQPLQGLLTYLIPVGIMITFPAKALMGLVGGNGVLISLAIGILALFLSFRFWNFALKKYASASS